jgi:hypothetical protein
MRFDRLKTSNCINKKIFKRKNDFCFWEYMTLVLFGGMELHLFEIILHVITWNPTENHDTTNSNDFLCFSYQPYHVFWTKWINSNRHTGGFSVFPCCFNCTNIPHITNEHVHHLVWNYCEIWLCPVLKRLSYHWSAFFGNLFVDNPIKASSRFR